MREKRMNYLRRGILRIKIFFFQVKHKEKGSVIRDSDIKPVLKTGKQEIEIDFFFSDKTLNTTFFPEIRIPGVC